MAHVLIVGVGNIGGRWLQGLQTMSDRIDRLSMVDVDVGHLAEARAAAVGWRGTRLSSYRDLGSIEDRQIDVAIVATAASVRRPIVEKLLRELSCRHMVLEKFLFPDLQDYSAVGSQIAQGSTRVWVNTPRRVWGGYKMIKGVVQEAEWVDLRVHGGERFPLGTTAIHYVDAWSWLLGEGSIELNGADVDPRILRSKRPGSIELGGVLTGGAAGGGRLEVGCRVGASIPLLVEVLAPHDRWLVDESLRTAEHISAQGRAVVTFEAPFQSELAASVVSDLLDTNFCGLPAYDASAALHRMVLHALLPAYRTAVGDPSLSAVPIT